MGELITAKRDKTIKSVFARKQAINARQFVPHRGNRLFTLKPYGKELNRFTESWKRGRAKHSVIIQDRTHTHTHTHIRECIQVPQGHLSTKREFEKCQGQRVTRQTIKTPSTNRQAPNDVDASRDNREPGPAMLT